MVRISVYLADKQVLFREGIHFTLSGEEDIEVIGETTSNEEALNFIQSSPPAVAILNINHGKPSGIEIARLIKRDLPGVAVILVMDSEDEELLYSAMKSGASACVTKDIDPDTLLKTIRDVSAGRKPMSQALFRPGTALRILEDFETALSDNSQLSDLLAHLTTREAEILRRISEGNTTEQIAAALSIGEETVNAYLGTILTKMAANDHCRELIAATQQSMTSLFSQTRVLDKPEIEYITREEFSAFQQNLRQRLGFLPVDTTMKQGGDEK